MLRKNYEALGAFLKDDRPRALDNLGFASQLVFTTWCLNNFGLERPEQAPLAYATATAHNRMMQDFTATDRRFLGTAYIPLIDIDAAIVTARAAIAAGAKALLIPSRPQGRSASHIGYDPIWALAQEAGLPILFHVGDEKKLDPQYFDNGLPRVKDFHGGEENFTSVSYMAIPHSVELTLAAMILDGVLDRFPKLKVGVIELGASWLPGWMRNLDGAAMAFSRNEERLQKLSMKPSEFIKRQVRVTPYPHEDVGWLIANAGEEIFLFSFRLSPRRRRPEPAETLRRQPRENPAPRRRALLLRQFHRPHGRGPRPGPAPSQGHSGGLTRARCLRRLHAGASLLPAKALSTPDSRPRRSGAFR